MAVRSDDLPDGTMQCNECRGRGSIAKIPYRLMKCEECEGVGFKVIDMDKELAALLGQDNC